MKFNRILSALMLTILCGVQCGFSQEPAPAAPPADGQAPAVTVGSSGQTAPEKRGVTPRQFLEQGGYEAAQQYLEKLASVVFGAEGAPYFDVDLRLIKQDSEGQPRVFVINPSLKGRQDLRDKLKAALTANFRPPAIGPIRKMFNNVVRSVAQVIYVLEGNFREMAQDLDSTSDFPALLNKIKTGAAREKDNSAKEAVLAKIMEIADISVGQPNPAANGADVVNVAGSPVDGYVLNRHEGLSGDEYGTWGQFLGQEVFDAINSINASMGIVEEAEPEPEVSEGPTLDTLGSETDFAQFLENARNLFENLFIDLLRGQSQDGLNKFLGKVADKHKSVRGQLTPEEHNELVDNVKNTWNISIQALKVQGKATFAPGSPEKGNLDYLMGLTPMGTYVVFNSGDSVTIAMGGKAVSTKSEVNAPVLMDEGNFFDGSHTFKLAKDSASGSFAILAGDGQSQMRLALDSAGEMVALSSGQAGVYTEKELFDLRGPSGAIQIFMNVGDKAGFVRKFVIGNQQMLKFSEGTPGDGDRFDIRVYPAGGAAQQIKAATDPAAAVQVVTGRLTVPAPGAAQAQVAEAKKANNRLLTHLDRFISVQEAPGGFAQAVSDLAADVASRSVPHDGQIIERINGKVSVADLAVEAESEEPAAPVIRTLDDEVTDLARKTSGQYFSTADEAAKLAYLNQLGKIVFGVEDMFELSGGRFVAKDKDGDGSPDPMPAALGSEFDTNFPARVRVRDAMITFGSGQIDVTDDFKGLVLGMFTAVRGNLTELRVKLQTMIGEKNKNSASYTGLFKLASFPAVINTETKEAKEAMLAAMRDVADVRLVASGENVDSLGQAAKVIAGGVTRGDVVKNQGVNAFTGATVYGQNALFDGPALFSAYDAIQGPIAAAKQAAKAAKTESEVMGMIKQAVQADEAAKQDRRNKELRQNKKDAFKALITKIRKLDRAGTLGTVSVEVNRLRTDDPDSDDAVKNMFRRAKSRALRD